tara:strand:+ start:398 stop:859 length:462 start_codon:yes stop_codon:yes gene_type:complete
MTPDEEFWTLSADNEGGCWLWTGPTTHNGYGRFHRGSLDVRAHRHAYELTVGPIPTGRQIDHTCHERLCINPSHLQAVTPQQNSENLSGAHRDSQTGVRGVYWSERSQRFIGEVYHGRRHYAGAHKTLAAAEEAVRALRIRLMSNNLLDRQAG